MGQFHPLWLTAYEDTGRRGNKGIWWQRRQAYFKSHPRRCEACNRSSSKKTHIQLHHSRYEGFVEFPGEIRARYVDLRRQVDWGLEPDDWLRAVCGPCHRNIHAIARRGNRGDLEQSTDWYINMKRRQSARSRRAGEAFGKLRGRSGLAAVALIVVAVLLFELLRKLLTEVQFQRRLNEHFSLVIVLSERFT